MIRSDYNNPRSSDDITALVNEATTAAWHEFPARETRLCFDAALSAANDRVFLFWKVGVLGRDTELGKPSMPSAPVGIATEVGLEARGP